MPGSRFEALTAVGFFWLLEIVYGIKRFHACKKNLFKPQVKSKTYKIVGVGWFKEERAG